MTASWESCADLSTPIGFLDFGPAREFEGFLVIRKRASSRFIGAQKNSMRRLWPKLLGLVRPEDPAGTRAVVRRSASLSGHRGAPRRLLELRQGEARAA